jgi:hypothetical protein
MVETVSPQIADRSGKTSDSAADRANACVAKVTQALELITVTGQYGQSG